MYEINLRVTAETRRAIGQIRELRQLLGQTSGMSGVPRPMSPQSSVIDKSLVNIGKSMRQTADIVVKSMKTIAAQKDRLSKNFQEHEQVVRRTGQAYSGFANIVRAGRNVMREFEQTFLGRGFFNITRLLFAPLAGIARGFNELKSAGMVAAGMLRSPSFVQATNIFRVMGHVVRGAGDAMGGLIAQAGRLAAFPLRAAGGILSAFGGGGKIAGGLLGGAGKIVGVFGDVAGELVSVAGKLLGGLADLASAALKPIAGIFDMLLSPVTMIFTMIRFAWQFSLIAMTGATVMFVKKSVSEFTQFEKNVAKVMMRAGGGGGGLRQFGDLAMRISREVGTSVDLTAKAIERAVGAGFKNIGDAGLVAEAGAKLSVASMSDIGTSTEAITNLLEGFGLGAKDAGRAADVLFAGFQQGTLDMSDMAQGTEKLAPLFHQLGSSMEEMIALTALLSRSAGGEMTVFTELAQSVQRIVAPSVGADKAIKSMGISLIKTKQGGLDLVKTLPAIGVRLRQLAGGDPVKMEKLLGKIVPGGQGGRSQRALLRLFGMSPEEITSAFDAVAKGGSVQKGMRAVADQLWRQGDILGATWERLKISVGEGLKPIWERAIQGLENFFGAIEKASSQGRFQKLGKSLSDAFGVLTGPAGFTEGVINFFADTLPNAIETYAIPALNSLKEWTHGFDIRETIAGGFEFLQEKLADLSQSDFVTKLDKMFASLTDTFHGFVVGMRMMANSMDVAVTSFQRFFSVLKDEISALAQHTDPMGIGAGLLKMTKWSLGAAWDMTKAGGRAVDRATEPAGNYAAGGIVPGVGSGDKVPAMLEPGELVVPRNIVNRARSGFGMAQGGQASGPVGSGLQTASGWFGAQAAAMRGKGQTGSSPWSTPFAGYAPTHTPGQSTDGPSAPDIQFMSSSEMRQRRNAMHSQQRAASHDAFRGYRQSRHDAWQTRRSDRNKIPVRIGPNGEMIPMGMPLGLGGMTRPVNAGGAPFAGPDQGAVAGKQFWDRLAGGTAQAAQDYDSRRRTGVGPRFGPDAVGLPRGMPDQAHRRARNEARTRSYHMEFPREAARAAARAAAAAAQPVAPRQTMAERFEDEARRSGIMGRSFDRRQDKAVANRSNLNEILTSRGKRSLDDPSRPRSMDERSRAKPSSAGTAPFNRQTSSGEDGSRAIGLASEINALAGGAGIGPFIANLTRELESAKKKMQAVEDDVSTLKSGVA